jgi:hypothetical protein
LRLQIIRQRVTAELIVQKPPLRNKMQKWPMTTNW